ncbi:23S rRNA methyltransferase [Achromatium sp. WMS2]|nr:23S rRNA methyltransferase [Achromatium sp. WMS2]
MDPHPLALDSGIVAGIHPVRTALLHGTGSTSTLWYDAQRHDNRIVELLKQAQQQQISIQAVDRDTLDNIAPGTNHQGIVAKTVVPTPGTEADLQRLLTELTTPALFLILDGVQDPHNLGACLRTAEAAGVTAVIAPRNRAVGLTPSVCKVASGAAGRVAYIQVTNLVRTLRVLLEHQIYLVGTADEASMDFYHTNLQVPVALVLGSEGQGLRRLTREHCNTLVKIPMLGRVESLNVSVAAGVMLYEAVRQRGCGSTGL